MAKASSILDKLSQKMNTNQWTNIVEWNDLSNSVALALRTIYNSVAICSIVISFETGLLSSHQRKGLQPRERKLEISIKKLQVPFATA